MLQDVIEKLEEAERIAILTHHNADLDSVGSALVLKWILEDRGKDVMVGVAESVSKSARQVVEDYEIEIDPEVDAYDILLTIDAASEEQLNPIELDGDKLVVIDHHEPGDLSDKATVAHVDTDALSSAQIVYQLVKEMDAEVTPEMAQLLIGGIVGDTGYLRFADIPTFRTVTELLEIADEDYEDILNSFETEKDRSEKIALLKGAKRIEAYSVGDVLVAFTTVGAFEASAARSLLKLGADVSVVAVPRDNEVRMSGRMNWDLRDEINLATDIFEPCADLLGGSAGGHDAAASANGTNPGNISETFDRMLELLEEKIGEKAKEL